MPGIIFLIAGSAEVTSRPDFCVTCHYMEPFYTSWKESSHNDVTCVKCHFPPGIAGTIRGKVEGLVQVVNYMTSTYIRRKPWAEIDDASCLQSGCHDTRLLKGKVKFHNVSFDHEHHIGDMRRGKDLRCTSCHSQIVQGDHMVVTETTCFLCHFKQSDQITPKQYAKISNCKTCHDWTSYTDKDLKFVGYDHKEVKERNLDCEKCHQNTIIGDGFVAKENCYSCHFDSERLDKFEDTKLLHKVHISENKIECIQCHLRIQHKIQKLTAETELDCKSCHTGEHSEQLILFAGKSVAGINPVPDKMFMTGLNCNSCHTKHKMLTDLAGIDIADESSCESCHGTGYSKLLKEWKLSAEIKLREINADLARVESAISNASKEKRTQANVLIDKAKQGIHIVQVGKAVHNINYSNYIISSCAKYLQEALKIAGSGLKLQANYADPKDINGCKSCHSGIEKISRMAFGSEFSHEVHIVKNNIECSKCHSNEKVHGELILNGQSCNSCHHQKANQNNCFKCHENQAAFYKGTIFTSDTPDIMFAADVTCSDCHVKNKNIIMPRVTICADCHDEEYTDMAKEWKTDITGKIERLRKILSSKGANLKTGRKAELESRLEVIEKGSTSGIHNYELSGLLLDKMEKELINL